MNVKKNNVNKNPLPLGVFVKTVHTQPIVPKRKISYSMSVPSVKKKPTITTLKGGGLKACFRIDPPKINRGKNAPVKIKLNNNKNNQRCTKQFIEKISSSNMTNTNKVNKISRVCRR